MELYHLYEDENLLASIRMLLHRAGENEKRSGLLETPKRFLKAFEFYTSGYQQDPRDVLKCFEDGADGCDELVCEKNIPFWSMCEHHLAPFFGVAHIGYIPNGKVVGLSKLPRLLEIYARRLQIQERLTNQVADAIHEHLKPIGVGVVLELRHTCMECRGVQKPNVTTITSALRGALKEKAEARAEFMALIHNGR